MQIFSYSPEYLIQIFSYSPEYLLPLWALQQPNLRAAESGPLLGTPQPFSGEADGNL